MKLYFLSGCLLVFTGCNMFQNNNTTPKWSDSLTIYEVNLRQFTSEGTIDAFRNHLPRLKSMGVGILWFMPIHPIGKLNRKGTLGSYYSVMDYYQVNPEFGTLNEFKSLVETIHEMGMYVIIDWVANHTSWDNNIVDKNPNWFTKSKTGKFQHPPGTDWLDVIDLNYDNYDLRKYMTNAMTFWVKYVNVDGFRCDVANLVPTDFWKSAISELRKIKPIFMLAESDEPDLLHKAFDTDYNWGLYHLLKNIANGQQQTSEIKEYYLNLPKSYPSNSLRMNFLDNHDENSWGRIMVNHFGKNIYPIMTMIFTLPGVPMIYSGQEAKLNKQLKFFEKDSIEWVNYPDSQFYQNLIMLKKNNPVFWNNNYSISFVDSLPDNIIGFYRKIGDEEYGVMINLTSKSNVVNITKSVDVIFKDEKSQLDHISPSGYLVYKIKK